MGEGRITIDEKECYLLTHGHKFFHNADFVNVDTYKKLFEDIGLDGKTIVNVGAGFALSSAYKGITPMVEAISSLGQAVTLIPVDYDHIRTKSWLLLDTNKKESNDAVNLEPVTGDARSLPFKDNSLDGYLSTNLINESRKLETELSFVRKQIGEAYRVLKQGGFLVMSSFGYFWYRLKDGTVIFNGNIDLKEIVERDQIEEIIKKIGFSSVSQISLDEHEIQETIKQRLTRKDGTVECGVREECAFIAIK